MHAPRLSGLTLLEMILVLAVIVAVAAMSLPALQGPMNDQRLRKAADLILAQWSKARLQAIKTGQIQIFQFQTGSDLFQVQAWASGVEETGGQTVQASTAMPLSTDSQALRDAPLGVTGMRLPTGITFFLGETEMDSRLAMSGAASADISSPSAPPIVFYPDGSTSDARLILTNERFCVELKLRGLTGLARCSQLLNLEEIQP